MAATTPGQIDYIVLVALRGGLRMEARGMRLSNNRPSALSVARRDGITTKRTAREALVDVIEAIKVHPDAPHNQ